MARPVTTAVFGAHSPTVENGKARLQAAIFDMDGVIIDSHPAHRKAWRRFLTSLGCDVSDSDLDFILDGRKRTEILRHFLGDLSEDELEEKGKQKDQFFQELELEVKPIRGVIDFLQNLRERDIAMAIATSASGSRARSTLSKLGISDLFQVIITGGDVPKGKPDPTIYRIACEQLRLEPRNVLAFEDAVSGVRAAKGAGIRCVGIADHEASAELIDAGADCVLQDFGNASMTRLEAILHNS